MLTSGGNRDVLLSNVKTRCLVKQSSVVLRGWRGEIQLHREATVGAGGSLKISLRPGAAHVLPLSHGLIGVK